MSVRPTTLVGVPVLRAKAKKVADFKSAQVKRIITDLTDSMRSAQLVGMAAPQIGIGLQIFVTEVRKTKQRRDVKKFDPLRVFINPRITSRSKKTILGYEGCGSVAPTEGLFAEVPRSDVVTVTAQDQEGKKFTLKATGLLARIIQHEQDHLEGKVFLDRVVNTRSLRSRTTHIKAQAKKSK
jgi:peptide deformylase